MAKKYKARNSVALEQSDLVKEWHKAPSKKDTPYNVTAGSDKIVTWCCMECGYFWDTRVKSRAIKKTGVLSVWNATMFLFLKWQYSIILKLLLKILG